MGSPEKDKDVRKKYKIDTVHLAQFAISLDKLKTSSNHLKVDSPEPVNSGRADLREPRTPRSQALPAKARSLRMEMSRVLPTTSQAIGSFVQSWISKKFMSGCAVLFPVVITAYVTWWILDFFDGLFSPIYEFFFGFHVFGLGFISAMLFVVFVGVFASSYVGGLLHRAGEWLIAKVPLVKQIYSVAKQISNALSPHNDGNNGNAFQECVMIQHPRNGEFAFAFITGSTIAYLPGGPSRLYTVYVPTNHVYVGDVYIMGAAEIYRLNITVSEGLEIVVSCGMAVPHELILTSKRMDEAAAAAGGGTGPGATSGGAISGSTLSTISPRPYTLHSGSGVSGGVSERGAYGPAAAAIIPPGASVDHVGVGISTSHLHSAKAGRNE